MDEKGSIQIPVSNKAENLKYDILVKNYENYDSMLVLSHFKGHAEKIGLGSREYQLVSIDR